MLCAITHIGTATFSGQLCFAVASRAGLFAGYGSTMAQQFSLLLCKVSLFIHVFFCTPCAGCCALWLQWRVHWLMGATKRPLICGTSTARRCRTRAGRRLQTAPQKAAQQTSASCSEAHRRAVHLARRRADRTRWFPHVMQQVLVAHVQPPGQRRAAIVRAQRQAV